MALIFNGVDILKAPNFNGSPVKKVIFNGSEVWSGALSGPGSVIIDTNSYTFTGSGEGTVIHEWGLGNFTPPSGVTEVTLCMIGAGGGGYGTGEKPVISRGGGYGGDVIHNLVTVVPGAEYHFSIGTGGAGGKEGPGSSGTPSDIFGLWAGGGAGGVSINGYNGDGELRTTCAGTAYDGARWGDGAAFGGQAGFGKGGDGRDSGDSEPGGIGAGGGATTGHTIRPAANGGNGQIRISWEGQA